MKLVKILAVTSLLVAGAAQAGGYADLQYYQEENRNTNKENIKYAVTVGNKVDGGWDYSLKWKPVKPKLVMVQSAKV